MAQTGTERVKRGMAEMQKAASSWTSSMRNKRKSLKKLELSL